MGLIIFGLGFGLFIGFGLFMLIIYPALSERRKEAKENQASGAHDSDDANPENDKDKDQHGN